MTAGSVAPKGGSGTPRTPKGMHDVLWPESSRWEATVARFAALVQSAGYGLVLTPIVEHAGVFLRGIGEGSEVVGKEMYLFEDRDGQMMALRPEGTAPVVRAFVQHHPVLPWKAWYAAPSFRHENPQHGRYRQHAQLGVEALGPADADLDVEVVSLAHDFFAGLGLRAVELKLHSMGDDVCKPGYVALLGAFLKERADQLCPAHRERHLENPLRVLDCKTDECRKATEDAPHFLDHLCDPCAAHFARVRAGLDVLGVPYVIDTAGGEAAVTLTAELRRAGLRADRAFDGRSMKSQIKSADRSGALVALVVGPQEVAEGTVGLRPLRADEEQRSVPRAAIVDELEAFLHRTPT